MKLLAFALILIIQDTPETKESIRLRKGIVGGIVAPEVTLSIDIVATKDEASVRLMKVVNGKEVVTTGTMTRKEYDALLKEIDAVWKLPIEDPIASEDIYALDTGVAVESGARKWGNSAPGGCGQGKSKTQATRDQKAAFERIVERIKREADAKATKAAK